jgi:hypothetical protein
MARGKQPRSDRACQSRFPLSQRRNAICPVITSDGRLVGLPTRRDAEEALPQFGG